jgi:hypothetical protein
MIYCYDANTCGNCANPYSLQCSPSIYSTISRSCVNESLTQRYQQSTYSSAQFQIIAQWPITTAGAGYQQIVANSAPNMMNRTALVGDILAFQGLFMAKEISTDTTQDYRCITPTIAASAFTCSVGSLSSNGTTYRYLLQTTIIEGIQIAPIYSYSIAGFFSVQGTIIQNAMSYSASTILPVVYDIIWIEVVGPSTASVNVLSTFTAIIYPPSKYLKINKIFFSHVLNYYLDATASIYVWSINGNNTFNSTSNTMNISFLLVGTYTIGCQAQNLLTTKYNSTVTVVQDIITNFTLHAGNLTNISISEPFEVARFLLHMATGSNYACQVNYDTSQSTTDTYFYTYGYIPGSYVTYQYIQPGQYNVSQVYYIEDRK